MIGGPLWNLESSQRSFGASLQSLGGSTWSSGGFNVVLESDPETKIALLEPLRLTWSLGGSSGALEVHLESSRLTLEPWRPTLEL
jgi:hypothetical protein